jgi:hypothetical protein
MEYEPIFIRQCQQPKSDIEREKWFLAQATEAKNIGCTYCRFTIHPEDINRVMVEGWITRPSKRLPQRWGVTARDPATPATL